MREVRIGRITIAEVRYPDCTNFEGRKVLLFRATSMADVLRKNGGLLDPHFSDNTAFVSPVARFEPTPDGWNMAVQLAGLIA